MKKFGDYDDKRSDRVLKGLHRSYRDMAVANVTPNMKQHALKRMAELTKILVMRSQQENI